MQFSGSVISPVEAEALVHQLSPIPIEDIGSRAWKDQREAIERLNMCTHSNAVRQTDDYVKAFLLEHDKLGDVLHTLLSMEVWRQRVMPSVLDDIAKNPTAVYMYCSYEAILINLLECICFYEEVVTGFGDDILELIDYCWRQVAWLFSQKLESTSHVAPPTPEELKGESLLQHLERQVSKGFLTRAMGCISILWFIIDRLGQLPISATNAILLKNDLLVGLSEVLVLQPWTRRTERGVFRFSNGEFTPVSGDEVMRVCTPEAHTWFCLHKLLCDPECRLKYPYTQSRKEIILRTRRFLNETLVDQIPALESVQRALEELSFLQPPSGTEEKFRSTLIIEQVPRFMSGIDRPDTDWSAQAVRLQRLLNDPDERRKDAVRMSQLFDEIFAEQK